MKQFIATIVLAVLAIATWSPAVAESDPGFEQIVFYVQ